LQTAKTQTDRGRALSTGTASASREAVPISLGIISRTGIALGLEEKIIFAGIRRCTRKNSEKFSGAGFSNRFFLMNQTKNFKSTFLKLT
jgi:hypothetical protein